MKTLLRRLHREQDGQALYLVAASLIAILGMAALSIDIGFALHAQRELQANTDAAASAGGAAMPSPATANATTFPNGVESVVDEYSGDTHLGALYNVHPDLNVTSVTVSFACLASSTYSGYNLPPCATAANTTIYPLCTYNATSNPYSGCNVIKVVETATVPTFFAKIFGIKSLNLTATAIASASGSAIPYHIMLVLDATKSMANTNDTGCMSTDPSGTFTAEQCAQMGAQVLLGQLAPCAQGQPCTSGTSTPVDQVGIMAFPGTCSAALVSGNCPTATTLTNTTQSPYASDDYSCPATDPPITPYNNDPAYLILPFQTNYRTSDTSGLNTTSELAEVVGAETWVATDTSTKCGMPAPGGEGTFYAGAIVAAQTYLYNNHTAHVQDVMIILSDGDASATATEMSGSVSQNTGPDPVSTSQISAMNSNGTWSPTAECTQAVEAADWAKGQTESDKTATLIYSVSYGSENSGCTSGENVPAIQGNAANTPCATMASMASSPLSQYFFSVPQSSGSGTTVCSSAVQIKKLDQVFNAIAADLESSRLIPGSLNSSATWTVY